MPFGELNDLIACHMIANGATEKRDVDDMEMIPDID